MFTSFPVYYKRKWCVGPTALQTIQVQMKKSDTKLSETCRSTFPLTVWLLTGGVESSSLTA